MAPEVMVALCSFGGTAVGALGGIMASAKLTNYRIEQLEKKVDKHNKFGERIPAIEEKVEAVKERVEKLEQIV